MHNIYSLHTSTVFLYMFRSYIRHNQFSLMMVNGGLALAQLVEALRYKVAGSIPDGDIGIFH